MPYEYKQYHVYSYYSNRKIVALSKAKFNWRQIFDYSSKEKKSVHYIVDRERSKILPIYNVVSGQSGNSCWVTQSDSFTIVHFAVFVVGDSFANPSHLLFMSTVH